MTPDDALPQKPQAVLLLARGYSGDRVGRELGVNGRTVRRWREDPVFEAEVGEARRAILTEAVAALGAAARDAVEALHAALREDNPSIRVRAAAALLAALPAITAHVAFEERLAALEAAVRDGEGA